MDDKAISTQDENVHEIISCFIQEESVKVRNMVLTVEEVERIKKILIRCSNAFKYNTKHIIKY